MCTLQSTSTGVDIFFSLMRSYFCFLFAACNAHTTIVTKCWLIIINDNNCYNGQYVNTSFHTGHNTTQKTAFILRYNETKHKDYHTRPGSVLKPKLRFWGKTEPKLKGRLVGV